MSELPGVEWSGLEHGPYCDCRECCDPNFFYSGIWDSEQLIHWKLNYETLEPKPILVGLRWRLVKHLCDHKCISLMYKRNKSRNDTTVQQLHTQAKRSAIVEGSDCRGPTRIGSKEATLRQVGSTRQDHVDGCTRSDGTTDVRSDTVDSLFQRAIAEATTK